MRLESDDLERHARVFAVLVATSLMTVLLLSACGGEGPDDAADLDGGARSGAAGSVDTAAPASTRFEEVASVVGVEFTHLSRTADPYVMPTVMGGGAAVFDADGDGRLDLYLVQAGSSLSGGADGANQLFLQTTAGQFEVASSFGAADTGYGMGTAVGDVDGDGDLDLFVSNYGPDALYLNNGNGTFSAQPRSGLDDQGWGTSTVFFDYDRDGDLDLWLVRYLDFDPQRECRIVGGRRDFCGPAQFQGVADRLYRNDGRGRFEDVSIDAGVTAAELRGLGVAVADWTGDGLLDVYVANDADPNNLWVNQGDGTFVDDALLLGVAFNRYGVGEAGMGVTTADADDDGDLDLFVSHLIEETNTLYENLGPIGFEDASAERGLAAPSLAYTGFGTAFVDIDNDSDLDLAVANGAVKSRPVVSATAPGFWSSYVEPDHLLEQRGDGQDAAWVEVSASAGGFGEPLRVSRALVPFDLDGDGDQDLLLTAIEGRAHLWRNQLDSAAKSVLFELRDASSPAPYVGARITLQLAGRSVTRVVMPSAGYLSSYVGSIHFGLGSAGGTGLRGIESVKVLWPDGGRESFSKETLVRDSASETADVPSTLEPVILERGKGKP